MPATRIEATYRVVTPLFSAGADSTRPEVRLSSIKGVLRYWWRALAWSRCGGDLEVVRREEDRLFGSAGAAASHVCSCDWASVPEPRDADSLSNEVLKVSRKGGEVVGARSPLSGVWRHGGIPAQEQANRPANRSHGQLTRAASHRSTSPFRCEAVDLNEQELTSLRDALVALGVLGGLGAKSRKGYGSLALESLCV